MIDKKIVVTTPGIYSQRICRAFRNAGLKDIISAPVIVTRTVVDKHVYNVLFNELGSFDCVILPSRNAIDAFVRAAQRINYPERLLKKVRYATIGSDAGYLNSFGLDTGVETDEPSTKGIVSALKKMEGVKKIAVLVPKVEVIPEPDVIPDFLKELKTFADLTVIEAYITAPNPDFDSRLLNDIKSGRYSVVAFTSGGEVEALKYLLNDDASFKNIRAACFGPFTSATALRAGLKPLVTGTDFSSFSGFATTLKEYFTSLR
jgi:uroporphyrinogen-III synthase